MTKLIYSILLLTLALIGVSIFQYNKIDHLESRIETIGKYTSPYFNCDSQKTHYIEIQKFKEDNYIRQQEHDTTLILTVFAAIVGLVAFFTFRASKEEIALIEDRFTTKINQIVSEQKSDYNRKMTHLENFIDETRKQINYEAFLSRRLLSDKAFKEGNIPMYVFVGLSGLTYYVGYYNYFLKHEPSQTAHCIETIISDLKSILKNISDPFVISSPQQQIDKENIQGAINAILTINHPEINSLALQIQARIKYQ